MKASLATLRLGNAGHEPILTGMEIEPLGTRIVIQTSPPPVTEGSRKRGKKFTSQHDVRIN